MIASCHGAISPLAECVSDHGCRDGDTSSTVITARAVAGCSVLLLHPDSITTATQQHTHRIFIV